MANEDHIQVLKNFVTSLPEDKQAEFKTRFNGLDAQGKDAVIQNVVAKFSQAQQPEAQPSGDPVTAGDYAMAGPLARGVEALQKGISGKDIPYVAEKMASGFSGGAVENLAKRPLDFALAGGPGMQANVFGKDQVENPSILPKPATAEGKRFGDEMGTATSLFPLVEGLQGILGPAKSIAGKAIAGSSMAKATSKAPEFAEKVRDAFYEIPRQLGEKFGSKVDALEKASPDKVVNIGSEIAQLAEDARQNSDVARRIALGIKKLGDPEIAKTWDNIVNNRFFQSDWTLTDSQKFIRAVKNAPGMAGKLSKSGSRFDPNEIPLLEFYGNVRGRQIESFPEFSNALGEYAQKMQGWNALKGKFKFGQTINKVNTEFGDPEVERAIADILPKDLLKEIGGIRNSAGILKALKESMKPLGIATATGAGAYIGGKALGMGKK